MSTRESETEKDLQNTDKSCHMIFNHHTVAILSWLMISLRSQCSNSGSEWQLDNVQLFSLLLLHYFLWTGFRINELGVWNHPVDFPAGTVDGLICQCLLSKYLIVDMSWNVNIRSSLLQEPNRSSRGTGNVHAPLSRKLSNRFGFGCRFSGQPRMFW